MRTYPRYPRAEVQLNQDGSGKVFFQRTAEDEPLDISNVVSAVDVHTKPGDGTTVTLALGAVQAAAAGDVSLSTQTIAALIALGWTPPAVTA